MQYQIKYNRKIITPIKLIEVINNSGLSFGELSKLTGIPKSSIHRYASGYTKKIPFDAVRLIASATGVELSSVLGEEVSFEEKEKTAQIEPPLSPNEKALRDTISDFSNEEYNELRNYAEYVKQKRKNK